MSPRPGGESDKLGNRYEAIWTVRQVLDILRGNAESITVEELGPIGVGVEFTLRRQNSVEAHQVKRQRSSSSQWTLRALKSEGVLDAAKLHALASREFHFVSMTPAADLRILSERAHHSPDLQSFINDLSPNGKATKKVENFGILASYYGSAEVAWQTLRRTWVRFIDEEEVRNTNAALAGMLLSGNSAQAAAASLTDLILDNLAVPLNHQTICGQLADYGLSLANIIGSQSIAQAVRHVSRSWNASIERRLLQPSIDRREAHEITRRLGAGDRCVFAIGAGGVGKSAVLHDVVERAESDGWSVLAFRLDREEPFSSTAELGQRHGLGVSPVSALAGVANERPSLLVIDQLDAVSKASGRLPSTFDAVADLLDEATAFPNMRILLACRKFDLDNDHRIRRLHEQERATQVELLELSDEQVAAAVNNMGIQSSRLNGQQINLLRLPVHLALLSDLKAASDSFTFASSKDLFDIYWEQKQQDCDEHAGRLVQFGRAVEAIADKMSDRQRLVVPVSMLDDDLARDANVLTSEHVLVREQNQIAFFHETFFDYAFARRWARRGQSLVQFLLEGEQELFRRAQVRQILTYIREESVEHFVDELEALLAEPRVRFHIKDVALALLGAQTAPTTAEWLMAERLLESDTPFGDRLWFTLRTAPWFTRLDGEGVIETWLRGRDENRQHRAVEVMLGGVKKFPDRIAQILAPHAGRASEYATWLRITTRFADLHTSRPLFDLVLDAVRRGQYNEHNSELFLFARELGKQQPTWAVDLLAAYLMERPDALTLNRSSRIEALSLREHSATGLATDAAERAPQRFCEALLPYVLRVMALTTYEGPDGALHSHHFWHHDAERPVHDLEVALINGMAGALQEVSAQEPATARPLLDQLAADAHDTAQWLLYRALAVAGETYAEYAGSLLLDRESGLYATDVWTTQALIQAISPYLSDERVARLEADILALRPSWESRPAGAYSFALLSGLDKARLSATGRRRLGELQRLFNTAQLQEPQGPIGGTIGSPIPPEAAQHMSDEQWLRAIRRHSVDRTNWTTLQGGAQELSHVLEDQVGEDPARFAQLACRLTAEDNPAYADAILRGIGNSELAIDPTLVFESIRHIASLGRSDNDQWLGRPLRQHLKSNIPNDVLDLLLDRALHSPDPQEDVWLDEMSSSQAGYSQGNPLNRGIGTVRGSTAEMLGNILIYDSDGRRTSVIVPVLDQLANDPSVAVRACTAHLIGACLRHAEVEALGAFQQLIRTDDRLLATQHVERLIIQIGRIDPPAARPVISRMLAATHAAVREAGGRLAAYASLELDMHELLTEVRASNDTAVRSGAADVCAHLLPQASNLVKASDAVQQFVNDPDEVVRESAAAMAAALRGQALRPFQHELLTLIKSPSFEPATSQLLITLEHAPDRVDRLITSCAQRFIDLHRGSASDITTRAAADAHQIGPLLLRAYEQAPTRLDRAEVLDLIDGLLAAGAHGLVDLVTAAERPA